MEIKEEEDILLELP